MCVDEGYRAESHGGTLCEGLHGIANRLRHAAHHRFAVTSVIVFECHRGYAVNRHYINSDLEFRHFLLHGLVRIDGFAEDAIVTQYTDLVGEHDFRLEVIVVGDACKRIVLVFEGGFKRLSRLMDELFYRLLANLGGQSEGVDKHTAGVAYLQIATAVGDGGDAHVIAVGKTRQGIVGSGQHHGCRCDA